MKTEGGQASNKSGSHGKYPRLLVIIPAWNEAETIGAVLDELRTEVPEADVLVVSDGSTDQTVAVAESRGVAVLELPLNLGVGAAMRTGYLYAHRNDYDWAVQLDADGQHDPKDIPLLLQEAQDEDADLVIGARFAGKGDYAAKGPRKWAMSVKAEHFGLGSRRPDYSAQRINGTCHDSCPFPAKEAVISVFVVQLSPEGRHPEPAKAREGDPPLQQTGKSFAPLFRVRGFQQTRQATSSHLQVPTASAVPKSPPRVRRRLVP